MPYLNYDFIPLYVSLAVATALAVLAVVKRALTIPATVTAVFVLVGITAFTGYVGLVAFSVSFVGAVIVGFIGKRKREEREEGLHARKGARGVVQVLSNSLPSIAFGLAWFLTGKVCFLTASVTAVTAGFADSVGSDVGILSDGAVVNILTFKRQQRGLSGGVSAFGTVAAFIAAAVTASVVRLVDGSGVENYLIVTFMGFLGTIVDSVLGASVQALYECTVCGARTERTEHCGKPTVLAHGLKKVDNNVVNFIASAVAGSLACLIAYFTL